MRRFQIPAILLLLLSILPARGEAVDLEQIAGELGMDSAEIVEPLFISPEMKAWGEGRIPRSAPTETRLKLLLEALRSSEDIEFTYHAGYTGTAREVFTTGQFNCLSFSLLFVSMARSLGLEAYFLNVGQVEEYEKQGDLVILTRHVTAGHGPPQNRVVLELDVGPEINYQLAEPIGDYEALSLYYSNRGTEHLRAGELNDASRSLELAVRLDPKRAQNWVNLGVVERHLGRSNEAERAYLRALEVEPGFAPAYENLATLLRLRGETNAAREILQRLDRRKNRNPFTFLALGDLNLEQGKIRQAEQFYRRALRLAKDEPETHAAMGLWALENGDPRKARSWFEKARRLGSANDRLFELEMRLLGPSNVGEPPMERPEPEGKSGVERQLHRGDGNEPSGQSNPMRFQSFESSNRNDPIF